MDLKKTAVAVCAHPDDLEFFCGGSVAWMALDGWDVTLIVATDGDKGTMDPHASGQKLAARRRVETRRGAEVLGVREVVFLGKEDGALSQTVELRRELAAVYRRLSPTRLITFDPWRKYELHPDHREIGYAALDARLAAKLPLYYPEQLGAGLATCAIPEILLFNTDEPDFFVDITATLDLKLAALSKHESQWEAVWDDTARALIREAEEHGHRADCRYAEGFKRLYIPSVTVSSRFKLEECE